MIYFENAASVISAGNFFVNMLTTGTMMNDTAIATVPKSGAFALAAENAAYSPSAIAGDVNIEYNVIAATTAMPLISPAQAPAFVVFFQ